VASKVICAILNYPNDFLKDNESDIRLRDRIQKPFPVAYRPAKFRLTISDIQRADLKVVPTSNITEHLKVEGETVKVVAMDKFNSFSLICYDDNKVAS